MEFDVKKVVFFLSKPFFHLNIGNGLHFNIRRSSVEHDAKQKSENNTKAVSEQLSSLRPLQNIQDFYNKPFPSCAYVQKLYNSYSQLIR